MHACPAAGSRRHGWDFRATSQRISSAAHQSCARSVRCCCCNATLILRITRLCSAYRIHAPSLSAMCLVCAAGLLVLMSDAPRALSRRQRLWGGAMAAKLAPVVSKAV